MNLACPACGFLTIDDEAYGTYGICSVCGWEDDQVQLANPCSDGGANSESLYQYQLKVLREIPLDIKERSEIVRCANWRPLNQEEINTFRNQAKDNHWANEGVLHESETYWNKYS